MPTKPIGYVVSLCDLTGNMVRPWAEAGYECWCVDIQHSIRRDKVVKVGAGAIRFVWGDIRSWTPPRGLRFDLLVNQSPCTHVAVSGARDFAKKRGYLLREALELFEAGRAAAEWHGCRWVAENPVGVMSGVPHIGKPDHYFNPSDYTGWEPRDNYTKKTCIWCGNGFLMPPPRPDPSLGPPDDRIHKTPPSKDRGNVRSAAPLGFARAVFAANHPAIQADRGRTCP